MTTHETITPALTDEMIDELSHWLFDVATLPMPQAIAPSRPCKWIRSAAGIEAVETVMIERNFVYQIICEQIYWECDFQPYSKGKIHELGQGYYAEADNKAEAILLAAYKAMKGADKS